MPVKNNVFMLIDVEKKRYARYVGRQEKQVFVNDELLDKDDVEALRRNPNAFGTPEPEVA